MRPAKELFYEQAAKKEEKHPKTAPKIISFSLAMGFLGLTILLLGVGHAPIYGNITASIARSILLIFAIVTLQGAVVCSSIGVTSSKYTIYCICSASLAVSLALDVAWVAYILCRYFNVIV